MLPAVIYESLNEVPEQRAVMTLGANNGVYVAMTKAEHRSHLTGSLKYITAPSLPLTMA